MNNLTVMVASFLTHATHYHRNSSQNW